MRSGPASDDEVPAFWQALGLPGLIDVHTHFMPQRLLDAVWDYFDRSGPLIGRPWPIRYRSGEDDRVSYLRRMGVRRFTALNYPHKPGMAAGLNDWSAEFAGRHPDCLASGTFFAEPGATAYVAAAVDAGARVFKAHVQVGGYDPRDPLLDPVWGLLAEAAIPVVAHVGSGPVARGSMTGPGPMSEVLARHPSLVLVVAHLGAPEYEEFLSLADRFAGVHLDTTMAFTPFFEQMAPFPAGLRPRLVDLADRILLGSDFPNIPYAYADQLSALAGLDLGDAWLRSVCWDNGVRLFGAPPAPSPPDGPRPSESD
jgi:uncharacterized protein